MSSRHLIDPELLTAVDAVLPWDFSRKGVQQARALVRAVEDEAIAAAPPFPLIERDEHMVPGTRGAPDVRLLAYRPKGSKNPLPAFLHIHGGGFVLGFAEMSAPVNLARANALGCLVASVDYRLAPETPFPGQIEDCYAALQWMHAQAETLGVDPSRIAIGGESAGGGLAASLALLARDRGEIPVIHQHLIYPMLDDRSSDDSHPYTGEFVWSRDDNTFGWGSLLGRVPGGADTSAYAAAMRAKDLAGLPSTYISVGALDLFLEESLEYARRLMRAGVAVELHAYPGAYHGSDLIVEGARVSKQQARDSLDALQHALGTP